MSEKLKILKIIDPSNQDTVKLPMEKERVALFQEQAEWYRLNAGKLLCDCNNCINARSREKLRLGRGVNYEKIIKGDWILW